MSSKDKENWTKKLHLAEQVITNLWKLPSLKKTTLTSLSMKEFKNLLKISENLVLEADKLENDLYEVRP